MRIVFRMVLWLLKQHTLSVEEKNLLSTTILEKIGALPIRDIISLSENNEILVNGVPLEYDKFTQLREEAKKALLNPAMRLTWDQVRYESFKGGASVGQTPEDIFFFRTAIWNGEQERKWLRILAGVAE